MKKLFADPHYNVMDGLDVYIDDYSKPDPIPPRHAAPAGQRQVPGPVRPGGKGRGRSGGSRTAKQARDVADNPSAQSVAQSEHRLHQQYPSRPTMPTLICDCNKTMPLQEKTLGAALGEELDASLQPVPARSRRLPAGDQGRRRSGRGVHPGKAPVRRDRRADRGRGLAGQVRQHPRDRRLEPRRVARHAQDGRAAGRRAPARSGAGAHRHVQERGPPAGDRPAGRGRARRRLRRRRAGRHAVHPGRRGRAGAPLSGAGRAHRQPQGLAGRVRAEMDRATTRSTWTCARAATPAWPPARKARSGWTTRSTWPSARRTAPA